MMSQQTAAWAGRASAGRTPWSHFCLRQTWTAPSDPPTRKLSPGLGSHQGDFLWKLSRSALKSRNVIGTRRQKRRFASTFGRHLTEQRRQHRFSFYAWPWKFYRIQNIGTESNARDRSCQDRGGENICFANAIVQPCLNIAIISRKTIKESRHCRMLLLLLMSLSLQRYYGSP